MRDIPIFLICVAAAVFYGVIHDQITARLCIEYFTVAHRPVAGIDSPTMLAFYWGYAATWWFGALFGVPMVFVARGGGRPKLGARDLVRPLMVLLLAMGGAAGLAGAAGYLLFQSDLVSLGGWGPFIPPERHWGFMVNWFAHSASYVSGVVGGTLLMVWIWRRRGRMVATVGRRGAR